VSAGAEPRPQDRAATAPAYYPVFLDLRGRRCMVVGGGDLAAEKVRGLLAAGARVTVVGSRPGAALVAMARRSEGSLGLVQRAFRPGDLAGAFLVVAAEGDPAYREAVWREARRERALINSVDDVPHCDFIAGAVVRRGDLTVAISTGGCAPALAVRLRQKLEAELGAEVARFLELAAAVRPAVAAAHPDFAHRRELWYRLVDSDVLDLLRGGDEATARRRFAEILGAAPGADP
jgi:siroheme synthase-like protein